LKVVRKARRTDPAVERLRVHDRKVRKAAIRAKLAISRKNWLGAIRAVMPLTRSRVSTPAQRRLLRFVTASAYGAAMKASDRGDVDRARELLRALLALGGRYHDRVQAQLERLTLEPAETVTDPVQYQFGRLDGEPVGLHFGGNEMPPATGAFSLDQIEAIFLEPGGHGIDKIEVTDEAPVARFLPTRRTSVRPKKKPVRASGRSVTRRTPHMDLSMRGALPLGCHFEVDVWLDTAALREGETGESVEVRTSKQRAVTLSVTLVVSEHFRIHGAARRPMVLRPSEPESEHVRFLVTARKVTVSSSTPTLTALFEHEGRPSGKVARQPRIKGLFPAAPPEWNLAFAPDVKGTLPRDLPPADAHVEPDARGADLTVKIVDTGEKDGRHYFMIVDAPGEHWEGKWVLPKRSDEIVKNAMDVFTAADDEGTGKTGRVAALEGAGMDMFDVTPKEFQELFWRLIDTGKIPGTALVVSEEPYIPWELMIPTRWARSGREERPPFGVEFAFGRWVHDQYMSPPQKMAFTMTYVVAPRYSKADALPHAEDEARLVAKVCPPSKRITPANLTTLNRSVGSGMVTLLHFVCHGKDAIPQTIYLDHSKDNLNSQQVRALKGFVSTFQKARTFVFLNACEVGRPSPALVGIGGFANAFIKIGAGGVIAPLWSVSDAIAHKVAAEFYETLRRSPGTPFAKILQKIRKRAYQGKAEDTWAAYSYYGDPRAALSS
jgi:hypothetical protein